MEVARPGIADLVLEGARGILDDAGEDAGEDGGGVCCAAANGRQKRLERSKSIVEAHVVRIEGGIAVLAMICVCRWFKQPAALEL